MSMVWELDLSHDQRIVLLALADHADDDGYNCYPSIAYTAWKCGYSERSIQRILRKLQADELIKPLKNTKGGRGKAVEYRVQPWKGVKKPPFRNDDNMTPLEESVTPEDERVTNEVEKGDTALTPQPFNRQESSVRDDGSNNDQIPEPQPDAESGAAQPARSTSRQIPPRKSYSEMTIAERLAYDAELTRQMEQSRGYRGVL